jgi:hypothetical protein
LVRIADIHHEYSPKDYVDILDKIYLAYGIAIENDGWRIFPSKLATRLQVDEPYKSFLKLVEPEYFGYRSQKQRIGRLFDALSEMKMAVIAASQNDAVFAWETNACLYFILENISDAIAGDHVKVTYYIGGEKQAVCDRLRLDFAAMLDRFYGQRVDIPGVVKKSKQEI